MSPDPHAHDRIYIALKAKLAEGHYPPGMRIEIQRVADENRSSATPVREVLAQLVGEGLLEAQAQGGFRAAHLDALALASLYRWNGIILGGAFDLIVATNPVPVLKQAALASAVSTAAGGAATIASLFAAIAQASGNEDVSKAVNLVSSRLSFVRLVEPMILKMVPQEISDLLRLASNSHIPALRRRIAAYHRRRIMQSVDFGSVLPRRLD